MLSLVKSWSLSKLKCLTNQWIIGVVTSPKSLTLPPTLSTPYLIYIKNNLLNNHNKKDLNTNF